MHRYLRGIHIHGNQALGMAGLGKTKGNSWHSVVCIYVPLSDQANQIGLTFTGSKTCTQYIGVGKFE